MDRYVRNVGNKVMRVDERAIEKRNQSPPKKGGDKEQSVLKGSNDSREDFGFTSWVCENSVVLPDSVNNASHREHLLQK